MNNEMRRFGVLGPPGNIAMEREFPTLLPEGVVFNYNRLSRPGSGITADSLVAMAESIDRAAHDLAQAYPEVILYGCTSGSFLFGIGREAETARKIADLTGIPAITTSTAVVRALEAFGARRVALFTPYPDTVNDHEVEFLNHYGFDVPCVDAFRCDTSEAIRQVPSERTAELVLRHRGSIAGCDAVFISCTNLLSVDQIPALEAELGKPVISSNQTSVWAVLRAMGIDTRKVAAGRLFTQDTGVDVSRKRSEPQAAAEARIEHGVAP